MDSIFKHFAGVDLIDRLKLTYHGYKFHYTLAIIHGGEKGENMKFAEWYKQEYKESFSMQSRLIKIHAETAWDFSRESTIEECAKIADKYFRHMVSRRIAEEIRNLIA